jgi:pimeloyl-ACP methyl ester carboxylesterase
MRITRWLLVAFAAIALLASGLWVCYRRWLKTRRRMASADSAIVQTSLGPVEYGTRGEGAVILHFHGGNVGHNGWFFLEHLILAGYQVLTPDRPGYLGTPLDNGGSPEQQADLAAALLDKLGIERVAVVGISAGGPGAIQFAARHASRLDALVLLSAISQRTSLSGEQTGSALGRLVMTPRFQNLAYFLIHHAMTHFTRLSLQDFVRTETTYDKATGKRFISKITADPGQMRHVMLLADAMVPAMPRFPGVMNDLKVQQELGELPLEQVRAPTLIVGSRSDGDIGYENSVNANVRISGSTLITVEQFGHFIWWGDADVTRDFQRRIEDFLAQHVRVAGTSQTASGAV